MTEVESSDPAQIPQKKGKGKAVEEDTIVGKPISTNQVAVEYQLKAIEWIESSHKGMLNMVICIFHKDKLQLFLIFPR